MTDIAMTSAAARPALPKAEEARLREAAKALESTFLSEMLKGAGFGAMKGAFGGGIGEEQFASFLRTEQADAMTASGGLGLAEHIFQSLVGARRDA